MYHVSAQGVDERMINVHYYYYYYYYYCKEVNNQREKRKQINKQANHLPYLFGFLFFLQRCLSRLDPASTVESCVNMTSVAARRFRHRP